MVLILIVSTILSLAATTVIIFSGLNKDQKTSTTSRAQTIQVPSPTPSSTPTPIQSGPTVSSPVVPVAAVFSPYLTATTSASKNTIFITFNSVSTSKGVAYKVNYKESEVEKAAQGNISFTSADSSKTQEVIFGTCSGTNCVYDKKVTDLVIEATFTQIDDSTTVITYPYTL